MDNKTVSLSSLDMTEAHAKAFRFAFLDPDGKETGIFFHVLGVQSDAVSQEITRLVNARRQKEASREIQRRLRPHAKVIDYEKFESDVEFGQRLAAVRLVGWEGIAEPCTPENALKLCMINREAAAQITEASDEIKNFTTGSPTNS